MSEVGWLRRFGRLILSLFWNCLSCPINLWPCCWLTFHSYINWSGLFQSMCWSPTDFTPCFQEFCGIRNPEDLNVWLLSRQIYARVCIFDISDNTSYHFTNNLRSCIKSEEDVHFVSCNASSTQWNLFFVCVFVCCCTFWSVIWLSSSMRFLVQLSSSWFPRMILCCWVG